MSKDFDWHGYPHVHNLLSERPWWRMALGGDLIRSDGETMRIDHPYDSPADHDRAHPLPPPLLLAGQVWVRSTADGFEHVLIDRVEEREGFRSTGIVGHMRRIDTLEPNWWKALGILVYGPGSPWSPAAMSLEG